MPPILPIRINSTKFLTSVIIITNFLFNLIFPSYYLLFKNYYISPNVISCGRFNLNVNQAEEKKQPFFIV